MAQPADLISLYSKRILALAADMPHAERLVEPDGTASKRSPLCGSTVTVDIKVDNCRVSEFGQDVKACALGQASAAVLGANAIGLNYEEVRTVRDQLWTMLKEDGEPPTGKFGNLKLLEPARDYKNRHASIMLAYDALLEAMESIGAKACVGARG